MITNLKIKKAVNTKLSKFFTDVELTASHVKEGFKTPSFFTKITLIGSNSDSVIKSNIVTVNIHYFSKTGKDSEIMNVEDKLSNLFVDRLRVDDRILTLYDVRSDDSEGVLQFRFDLRFTEGITYLDEDDKEEDLRDDIEVVQELKIKYTR